ncbi:MAG: glycosyltransferase, partial [bacterium]|nr:glycosyltransferase [bacterium]
THPQVQLLVVGPLSEGYEGSFDRIPNVAAIGKVPVATDYYSAFDLYVSTSTREGLGSALIDAVVRDVPVVALDSGGVRDVLPEGVCVAADEGEFLDAVGKAVTDYEMAKREAQEHGVRVRSDFAVERMVEETLAVYEDVVCHVADPRYTHDVST